MKESQDIRMQLVALLERLEARRESSIERMRELGRVDPVQSVTGKTALEQAIDDARQMLARVTVASVSVGTRERVGVGSRI